MSISDDAEPRSYSLDTIAPHIVIGRIAARTDGGSLTGTDFYLEVTPAHVLLRYDDGVNHEGFGDEIIAFFSGLVPSLSAVAR